MTAGNSEHLGERVASAPTTAPPTTPRSSSLPWALWASVLALLALTAGAHPITSDSAQMCDAARNLIGHGEPYLSSAMRDDAVRGPDHHYFTKYPLMTVVGCVPTVLFQGIGQFWGGEGSALERYFVGLGPATLGSLGALGFFFLACELGFGELLAALVTLLLVFTTPFWHYARSAYSENLQAVVSVWALWAWVRARGRSPAGLLLAAGFLLSVALNLKALLAILAVAVVVDRLFDRWDSRSWLRVVLFGGLGAVPGLVAFLWYNRLRFGGILNLGYSTGRDGSLGFSGPLWAGLHGLLFSSGKSVFVYAPLLLLVGVGIKHMHARSPRDLVLFGVPVVFVFLIVAKWWCWSGDVAWGPRLVVPMIPLLFVPVLWSLRQGSRALHALAAGLAILGLYVTLLGVCIRPFQYVSVADSAVKRTLGKIDPDADNVRDDLILLHFVPELSPIVGHHWLLWRYLRDEGWDNDSYYPWRSSQIPAWQLHKDPGPNELNFWFGRGVSWPALLGNLLCLSGALFWLARCLWRARRFES